MASKTKIRGRVIYDSEWGHVCTCAESVGGTYYVDGNPTPYQYATYDNTVRCDRSSGTESGSFWWQCERCGAGTWSGL